MAQNSDLRDAKNLMSLPNMLDAQKQSIKFVDSQNLIGSTFSDPHNHSHSHNNTGSNVTFENISVSGDVEILGDIRIEGQLKPNSINMDSTSIVLSMDYNRITENMKHMSSDELEFLRKHLKKVEMMIEREQFDRT